MTSPRILVIGAGSIGRRHAANLVTLGAEVTTVDIEFDSAEFGGRVPPGFDGVVVASPTVRHAVHANAALAETAAVFIEKPLAMSVDDGEQLAAGGGLRIMVGYNLRYHAPLQRIAELLAEGRAGRPTSFRFWFGQWLPDWRPHVDYRVSYSARSDLGGGVLADAIHELDLAAWLVGEPLAVVGAMVDRLGPLEIDVEDTVRALLATPSGVPVSIELDYLARQYRRGVEVIGDEATVGYDWATSELTVRGPSGTETERCAVSLDAAYLAEMRDFMELVTTGVHPGINTADAALVSLRLAAAIRERA